MLCYTSWCFLAGTTTRAICFMLLLYFCRNRIPCHTDDCFYFFGHCHCQSLLIDFNFFAANACHAAWQCFLPCTVNCLYVLPRPHWHFLMHNYNPVMVFVFVWWPTLQLTAIPVGAQAVLQMPMMCKQHHCKLYPQPPPGAQHRCNLHPEVATLALIMPNLPQLLVDCGDNDAAKNCSMDAGKNLHCKLQWHQSTSSLCRQWMGGKGLCEKPSIKLEAETSTLDLALATQ